LPTAKPTATPTAKPTATPTTADWNQKGPTIVGSAAGDQSGISVSLSFDGSVVAIGAPYKNLQTGQVRVYEWNDSNWSQRGSDIVGAATSNRFGYSVSLSSDGSILAVGATGGRGRAKVYEWNAVSWIQKGGDMDGEANSDYFGLSVSLSPNGNRLAVGAPYNDVGGTNAGQVRVYEWIDPNWSLRGAPIVGDSSGGKFGYSVSLSWDGLTVAVGIPFSAGGGSGRGRVRVYEWDAISWNQKGGDMNGEADFDHFGWLSVSLSWDGNKLAGAATPNDLGLGGPNAGRVYVYAWSGNAWNPVASAIDGVAANDSFGYSVALSSDGTTVAAGAHFNDDNGANSGHVRVFHQY